MSSDNHTTADHPRVDIAIVGAGLVGTPLSIVLARQGWSVALLDANARVPVEGDSALSVSNNNDNAFKIAADISVADLSQRCTALSLGTKRWYESNGLWKAVASDACPIEQVHVSHKGYFGSTRLDADELAVESVGYVVSNDTLNSSMLSLLSQAGVQHISHAKVTSVSSGENHVTIHYADASLNASLLIAADGVSSVVRECAGIRTTQVDYDQCAALGTVKLHDKHANKAYERFTECGPLALLPRPDQCMTFVDCFDPEDRDEISSLGDESYLQRLQQRFGYRAGRFAAVGPRFITPLIRIEANEQISQRTVLLGNAARLLHPVGGQGYNLAIRDVKQLQLLLANQEYADPGNHHRLRQFVELRKSDQQRVVQFSDVLARSFRGKASLPSHARALSLIALDSVTPLRQRFARQTMGVM